MLILTDHFTILKPQKSTKLRIIIIFQERHVVAFEADWTKEAEPDGISRLGPASGIAQVGQVGALPAEPGTNL